MHKMEWTSHKRTANTAFVFAAIFAASASFVSASSWAAEIQSRTIVEGLEGIVVIGEIRSSDVDRFRSISLKHENAVVLLDSNGGALIPAIEIGKLIKIRGYSTLVPKDSICTSSCALIWLAGSTRWLSPQGRVGFHASYRSNAGRLEESGVGNALIGNYLTILNLPEKAIVFTTMASPKSISWLTAANRTSSGIEYKDFILDNTSPAGNSRNVAAAPLRPEVSPSARQISAKPDWIDYAESTSGSILYYDINSIGRSGSYVNVWVKKDHSKNRTVAHRTSMELWRLNCDTPALNLRKYFDYDKNGRVVADGGPSDEELTPAPESIGMALWESVCGWSYSNE